MKKISLVRIDESAEQVNLTVGEVNIGRGPLLNCSDKRISRNHGMLKLSDKGDIILVSTHTNPVFHIKGDNPCVEVQKDDYVVLEDKDIFALLPDSYKFRILISSEMYENQNEIIRSIKTKNALAYDEKMSDETGAKTDITIKTELSNTRSEEVQNVNSTEDINSSTIEVNGNITSTGKSTNTTISSHTIIKTEEIQNTSKVNENENSVGGSTNGNNAIRNRKRNLPSWMTNELVNDSNDALESSTSKNTRKKNDVSKGGRRNTKSEKQISPTKAKRSRKVDTDDDGDDATSNAKEIKESKGTKAHNISDDEEDNVTYNKESEQYGEEQCVSKGGRRNKKSEKQSSPTKTKKSRKVDTDDDNDDDTLNAKENKTESKGTKTHKISDDEEDNVTDNKESEHGEEQYDKSRSPSPTPNVPTGLTVTNIVPTGPTVINIVPTTTQVRQKCLYGATCYRKNPQHRIDFNHPGDPDHDGQDLPECPFGKTCYRKNKLHRMSYKHTTRPRKAKNQNKKTKSDDDEEDDYDYDDPFLNDGSSDDYEPTDSGSDFSAGLSSGEDEEDTKRMVKEAKKFTRKKK